MFRRFISVLILFAVLTLPESAFSTKMKDFWKNPSVTESNLQFSNVLVMVTIPFHSTRKVAEDSAVLMINEGGRAHAVPSYSILNAAELKEKDLVKTKVEEGAFDGVIVMRYAGSKDTAKYNENTDWHEYNYFWGQYYPGWGGVYNSQKSADTYVYIETMFYSLKDNLLIWSGITETKNPKNAAKVVGEIAKETTKYLQKEGLISKKKK